MKYVRTKDGVYEFVDYDEARYRANILGVYWPKIIKEADTIEELCDFVDIQYEDGVWETYSYENEFKIKLLFKKAKQVFYEIRTDKGLIYVAKMNEKGELELIWQL